MPRATPALRTFRPRFRAAVVRPSLPVLLAALLGACGAGPEPSFTATDSAGVRVVENRRPEWAEGEGWRVDPEPVLHPGGSADAPEFHWVLAAARLDDGGLVVADGTHRLRFLDRGGRPAVEAGGAGEGPGEYGMLATAGVTGDTVWSYDYGLRRLTYHDHAGGLLGVAPLRTERAALLPVGWAVGSGPVLAPSYAAAEAARAIRPGLRRDTVPYLRFDPAGEPLGAYGRFPAREYVVGEEEGRRTMATPLFARQASHALRGDRLIHGDQERYEIRVVAPTGETEMLIRRLDAGADVALGDGDRARELEQRVTGHGRDEPGLRRFFAELPGPSTRPAYGAVLVDAEGYLWVAASRPGTADAESWSVFDADGRWLGEVALPPRFRPLRIGSDEILGVRRDALDVEHFQVLRLHRR